MSNKHQGVIYVGVTDNLMERVKEHKLKVYPDSFTARYNCDKLIYFEEWENGFEATKREKQLKKWKRDYGHKWKDTRKSVFLFKKFLDVQHLILRFDF